jgi:WD40 repeat protein
MAREDMAGVGEVADLQGLIHASGISHDTAKATHAAARQQLSKIYQEFGRQLYLDGRCQQALPYMAAAREFGDSNESLQMMFRIATKSTIVSTALHRGVVNGVVFSADGRCFVTASDDGTACVWDSLSGTPITPFLKHGAPVATAVFSPDGHHIITACADGTARLWCSDTGQPMCEPLRHPDIVWVATFSPNGELAATLCISGLVQIWNAKTGALLDRAPSHSRRLWSGSFSPDSRYFATASADGYAHLYDMDTKKCVFLEHGGEVLSSTFNNDGSRIATTGSNGLVRLWNVRRGDCYGELRHEDLVWKAVFCSDGKRIASVSRDRTARIWNADTGELACTPLRHEDELWDISFNPDGRFVVTAGRSTAAQIWDTHDGRPVDPPLEHGGPIWTAAFSRDGCHIATASSDYKARIWNVVASCETIHRSFKHNGPVRSSVFSRDGTRVVTSSDDDTARVWDSVTGKAVTPPMEHASWVRRASFSPDGRLVVSEGSDNVARVWSAGEGTLHFCCSHDGSMLHAKFSPDGRSILTTNDSTARIWMLPVQLPSIELHHVDTVRYAEFSKSGALVGTACDNGEAHIWRSDGTHLRVHKYSTAVIRVLFNPTKETYAIICSSGQIDIWRMKTNTVEIKIRHQDTIFAAFSSDGNLLVTASADKTACIWDVTSGQLRSPPLKHENAVISAAFSPLGGRIATVSCDGTFAIWDSQSGRPLTPLAHQPSRVLDVSFSPDGEHLAISSEDGITQIVDIGMDQRSLSDWMHIVSRCPYSISNGMLNVSVLGDWVEEAVTGEDADAETAGEPAAVPRPGIREYRLGATLMGFPSLRGRPRGRMT